MAFNPILDDLPDTFNGVQVNTDFRQGLRFFAALADKELEERDKSGIIIRLFFPKEIPEPASEIWPFIEYFIAGGDTEKSGSTKARVFDFNVDAGRLYAAFLQTYQIDLREEKMHWWLFLELFRDLPEDTMLLKVIDIRGKKAPKYADADYKRDLRKAQQAFAIEQGDGANGLGDIWRAWAGS
jgi:hypothetical protein